MNLVQNNAGDVFAHIGYGRLVMFDGTPVTCPTAGSWQVVGEAPTVHDWQRDPGTYGPHYAVGTVVDRDGSMFVAGGSWVFIQAWCSENSTTFHNAQLVSDRNKARRRAEQRGGVAW